MMLRHFTMQMWDRTGTMGWQPAWLKDGDPTTGIGVAHDVLEHLPGDTGGAEAECRAIGAAYYVRGESGYFHSLMHYFPNPIWHLSRFVAETLVSINEGEQTQTLLPPSKPSPPLADRNVERAFDMIAAGGVVEANKAITYDRESDEPSFGSSDANIILAHLRTGYRSARRRYRHLGCDFMLDIFKEITRQTASLLLEWQEYPGARLVVGVNLTNGKLRVRARP